MSNAYNTETREIDGRKFRIEWSYDDSIGRPEEESEGHGVCADINFDPTTFGEDPEDGELDLEEVVRHKMMRVLDTASRRQTWYRVYDVWETMKVAKADGWRDLKWEAEHPNATEEEKLMAAVDADFNYLQGWYDDDWHWCGITVILLDEEGDPTEDEEGDPTEDEEGDPTEDEEGDPTEDEEGDPTEDEASLWGLCSDDDEYHEEVIKDLVSEIQRQVKREAEKGQIPLPL